MGEGMLFCVVVGSKVHKEGGMEGGGEGAWGRGTKYFLYKITILSKAELIPVFFFRVRYDGCVD